MAESIAASEAKKKVDAGDATLVCAYDDLEKCRSQGVPEATALSAVSSNMRGGELIFICA